jgi:hypothetical protein
VADRRSVVGLLVLRLPRLLATERRQRQHQQQQHGRMKAALLV